jgi:hypothetical protein
MTTDNANKAQCQVNQRESALIAPQKSVQWPSASVAQLDRASDFGSEGCRFKSCRMHHSTTRRKLVEVASRELVELLLSVKTVEVHRANIKTKLKLKSAPELIRFAVRWSESQGAGT